MNTPRETANLIEQLLRQKNANVNKMLVDCDLSRDLINNMKNKQTSLPSTDKLIKIANYLNVSVEYLTGSKNEPERAEKRRDAGGTTDDEILGRISYAFYGNSSKRLTKSDEQDLLALIRAARKLKKEREGNDDT